MIWSDNAHKVIAAARLNGSGVVVLVNSSINVIGKVTCLCACMNHPNGRLVMDIHHFSVKYIVYMYKFTICCSPAFQVFRASLIVRLGRNNRQH